MQDFGQKNIVCACTSVVFCQKDCRLHESAKVPSRWDGYAVSVSSKVLQILQICKILGKKMNNICIYSIFFVPLHPDYLQGGVVPDRYTSPQGRITIMENIK